MSVHFECCGCYPPFHALLFNCPKTQQTTLVANNIVTSLSFTLLRERSSASSDSFPYSHLSPSIIINWCRRSSCSSTPAFSRSSLTCFVIKINPWSSEAETGRAKPYMASRVEGGFLYRMVCVGMTFHAIFTGEFQRAARAAHAKATRPRGCRIVFRGSSSALWPPRPSDRALHLNLDLWFDVSHGQSILT